MQRQGSHPSISQMCLQVGLEFDSRPGLKFLVQKVTQLGSAANLYKQAGAAWSLMAITLFELCLRRVRTGGVNAAKVKARLESHQRERNTHQFCSIQDSEVCREDEDVPLLESDAFFVDLHNLFLDM